MMRAYLSGLKSLNRVQTVLVLLLAVASLSLPFWAGPFWLRVGTGVAMWVGLALSWNVICGYAGYISFGHVAFFGIGAYSTGILMQPEYGWSFFATLPVGAAVAGGLAAIIGWPVLRLRGAYFAIATLALGEAIREFATVAPITGGSYGLSLPVNVSSEFFYFTMLGATALAYVVCILLLEYSRFGYRVKAVRDSEIAARMQGINANLVKIQAFVLSAMIPAVLGGIYAYWITFINPDGVLHTLYTDQMVVMVLLGGLGTMWGPALGAAVLYMLDQQIITYYGDSTAYLILIGVLVMLVVLVLPNGLVSLFSGRGQGGVLRHLLADLVSIRPKGQRPRTAKRGDHDHH